MIIFLDGKFLPKEDAKISVLDHGFLYGDGVFTTFRTYDGKIFRLAEHIDRFFESAEIIELKIPWSKKEIAEWAKETYERNKNEFFDARIRISISRGVGSDIPVDYVDSCTPSINIIVSKLPRYDKSAYQKGISLMTYEIDRILPKSKNFSFIASVISTKKAKRSGYWDALMIDGNGYITESSTGNVFFVKNNVLVTPARGVLEGITRKCILEIAQESGIKHYEEMFRLDKILDADEVFITGTTKEILPVVEINKIKIASGKPGRITVELTKKFKEKIKNFIRQP